MADSISATPRNKLLGLLADSLGGASDWASQDNPPVRGLLNLLGVPAVTNTLNELSYGGALGTGSGMTWKPKADTLDAAMAVAPLVGAAPAMMNRGAAYAGKALEPVVNRLVDRTMSQGGRGAQMLTDMAQGTQSPLTVWHGSPHKFDAFDASKIGTGEGAQAYGHGLYLAESPDVARGYQEKLSGYGANGANGALRNHAGDLDAAIAAGEQKISNYVQLVADGGGGDLQRANSMLGISRQQVLDLKAMKAGTPENKGALYKVDLPDEHIAKMLDWDTPLGDQSQLLEQLGAKLDQSAIGNTLGVYNGKIPLGSLSGTNMGGTGQGLEPTGKDLYRRLHEAAIRSGKAEPAKMKEQQAAELMRQAGIPGIRYLDGGSRASGGTSNFVVFPGNEGLLNIMARNGQPVNNASGLLGQ